MPGQKIVLYGLKNCDTCRKAKRELESAGMTVAFVDIRDEADLDAKVPAWLKAAPEKLINKSSTTWRNLKNGDKAKVGTKGESELLVKYPTLIKRPVIETGRTVHVGWGKDVQSALLA
ncbi:MAG TPA: ArsC/Spx/MgsR family protein [Hyphomonas sp.]|nr:ArsC family transcriptional regulator [Hyphomonas sp.]HPE48606.1 ArsC/Spx/MgsR family protein [Hyphomonas sp.]